MAAASVAPLALDVARVRRDFPALAEAINGQRLVYLDNAATVQKPASVIEETVRCYTQYCANVHRGAHTLGARASAAYEGARVAVQELLGAEHPEEISFHAGCTAAINFVARAFGDAALGPGDEVIVTELEHHSNLLPWQELCARRGARLRVVPLDARGELDRSRYADWLGPRTKLVASSHVSNVLGTVAPIAELVELAHRAGAVVLVDGAQAVARSPVDVRALGCDFYAFSGHKLYGPFGIGALYARRDLWAKLSPIASGGGMVVEVGAESSSYADPPRRFEPGTPNLAGAAGLTRAIEYVQSLGLDALRAHDADLVAYARAALGALPYVRLIGDPERALGVVSFVVDGVHPHDASTILDQLGVVVRAGHHCAQLVMQRCGVQATLRASFAAYNDRDDVDALVRGIERAREVFAR